MAQSLVTCNLREVDVFMTSYSVYIFMQFTHHSLTFSGYTTRPPQFFHLLEAQQSIWGSDSARTNRNIKN